jgi:hypothetical protein
MARNRLPASKPGSSPGFDLRSWTQSRAFHLTVSRQTIRATTRLNPIYGHSWLNANSVIHGSAKALLASNVRFRRLHRHMAE